MRRNQYIFIIFLFSNYFFGQNEFVEIKGNVYSQKNNEPIRNAELNIKINDSIILKTISNDRGEYSFSIKKFNGFVSVYTNVTKDTKTGLRKREGFLASKTLYKINLLEKKNFILDFELTPGIIGYILPPLLFQYNSTQLVPKVYYINDSILTSKIVEELYEILLDNPKMVIELNGYMSESEKLENLSLLRSKYLAEELVKKGISSNNIKCIGLGKSQPLISNEMIKKAKSKSQKEKLDSQNRRVTFRVLEFGDN
ncbi:MAG: hypothetical protein H0U95_04010 [Bacteroidetes bacterium]|nr:hypothetical protein [Bacteroidota bacterium]